MSVWAVKAVIVEDRRRITGTSIREYRAHDPSFFFAALVCLFRIHTRAGIRARPPSRRRSPLLTRAPLLADGRRTQNTDTQRLTT